MHDCSFLQYFPSTIESLKLLVYNHLRRGTHPVLDGAGEERDMRRSGFTFIEILIVMVIIGIVAALGVPRIRDALQ